MPQTITIYKSASSSLKLQEAIVNIEMERESKFTLWGIFAPTLALPDPQDKQHVPFVHLKKLLQPAAQCNFFKILIWESTHIKDVSKLNYISDVSRARKTWWTCKICIPSDNGISLTPNVALQFPWTAHTRRPQLQYTNIHNNTAEERKGTKGTHINK